MAVLEGKLADRDSWSTAGHCPVERAMDVVGTKTSMLLMREAYYGTTRFDDFAQRVGVTEAAAAARLRDLVSAGLLTRRPYQEPGQRTRQEYVLTEAGRDLLPVVLGLFDWGNKHLPGRPRLRAAHHGCGAGVHVEARCTAGHDVPLDELAVRVRPRAGS